MNILIITPLYTPALSPRAFRWSSIAEIWIENGINVDVVSAFEYGLSKNENKKGVMIHRVGGSVLNKIRAKLKNKQVFVSNNLSAKYALNKDASVKARNIKIEKVLKFIHDITWKKIYWPDYACLWYFSAVKKAAYLLNYKKYDALISVSLPFTSHLVGYKLKKKTKYIPWIIDVGDPFSFMDTTPINNHRIYRRINFRIEKDIFKLSNKITVTTAETAEMYKSIFPESSDKIEVIPPLLDNRITLNDNVSKLLDNNKINLSYIGNFYHGTREPDRLLLLFRSLLRRYPNYKKQLILHIFGSTSGFQSTFKAYSDLYSNLILHGSVHKNTALHVMRSTNFLINIGNKTQYQLPSKIVEYVASGRPIINICGHNDDSSEMFLKHYPLLHNVFLMYKYNPETINDLVMFIKSNKNQKVDEKTVKIILQPYISHNIANKYKAILEKL